MAIENQLEQQDSKELFKLVDPKLIGSNFNDFDQGLGNLENNLSSTEKTANVVEIKNSLSDAEKTANTVLHGIQTEVNNLGVFNPPVDLNKAIGLLSPEMIQYGIAYDTKFRPKDLKDMFPEAKQSKRNPRTANFTADLLSLCVHLKQSLVDAEQIKNSDRPTMKTPSMEVAHDMMEMMKTNFPEFHGEKIVAIITETLAQQEKEKTEGPKQEQLAAADSVLLSSPVTAS